MIETVCILILIIMTIMGSVASLFLKKASGFKSVKDLITNINLYLGGGIYFLAALLNVYILKYLDYSTVLPMTSLTYIWTMILSYMVLKEKISRRKIVGVVGILVGALLITL